MTIPDFALGPSLGEQPHPAGHCDLDGRPHLGPCIEPGFRRTEERALPKGPPDSTGTPTVPPALGDDSATEIRAALRRAQGLDLTVKERAALGALQARIRGAR